MKFFAIIIIFLLALSLFLAMSVGVAFGLVWLFPAISFEIGVLIGTVSLSMMFHVFIKITPPGMDFSFEDDNYIVDKINDEHDLYQFTPTRPTRSRRKRR
jgi:hypothetical protein